MSSLSFLISKFDESIKYSYVGDITFPIQGLFVVDLPDGAQVDTPSDYSDLKSKKQSAIQTFYPDLPSVVYNELDNISSIDTTIGDRHVVGKYEWMVSKQALTVNGRITTTSTTLSGSPTQGVVFWSLYSLSRSDGEASRDITFTEEAQSSITCEVSVDGGSTWDTATYNVPFVPSSPGTNFQIRFTNSSTSKDLYLGYYCFLYTT